MSRKLIGTFGGIPIWANDDCPQGCVYIIPAKSEAEVAEQKAILGKHFLRMIMIKDVGVDIAHCACGALLVAGKCIRCEEDRD